MKTSNCFLDITDMVFFVFNCAALGFFTWGIAENHSGKGMAESMIGFEAEKIGMYQFYSTSAVFYSGKVAVKLTSSSKVPLRQAEALDWSSKYTMPTQGVADFGAKSPLSDHLII